MKGKTRKMQQNHTPNKESMQENQQPLRIFLKETRTNASHDIK